MHRRGAKELLTLLAVRSFPVRRQTMKKPQTRGESGLLRVPYGGNLMVGRERPTMVTAYHFLRSQVKTYCHSVNLNAWKAGARASPVIKPGAGPRIQGSQKKGAQPLRVVGRQKRVFFARVPGGKPARANHIFG